MTDFDLTTIDPRKVDIFGVGDTQPSVTRVPSKAKRIVVAIIAAAAAIVAVFGTSEPTSVAVFDIAWRMTLAAIATFAASTARRWSLLWLASLAVVLGGTWIALGCAAVGLAFAAWSALMPRHNRVVGALAGAFAVQALLRPPDTDFRVVYAVAVVAAILPVCYSAYRLLRRRHRRYVRRTVVITLGAMAIVSIGAAATAFLARSQMNDAVAYMRSGLAAIDAGDDVAATGDFIQANELFTNAENGLNAPWSWPARAVPVVAQHVEAADAVATSGVELSSTAANVSSGADYRDIRLTDGRIDLRRLERIKPTVDDAAEALDRAEARMTEVRNEFLLPPLDDAVQTLASEIDDVRPETQLAVEALDELPGILGGSGTRRYLVAVTSPNETRNSGGFLGGFAELEADEGKITKVRSGSVTDLNSSGPAGNRTLTEPSEFVERYSTYEPARFIQNATASPDLPTTARVLAKLYPQAGGSRLNGVVFVDPVGLAALLELTGPITVEGIDRQINAENVEAFLLKGQYVEYPDNADRDEIQANVASATFDALLSTTLPGPKRLGEVLGPVVAQGHIGFWTFDESEQEFLRHLGLDSTFDPGDDDFLSVRIANAGPNKLDAYLRRDIDYDVELDPASDTYKGTVTVTLTNEAPANLSEYVAATRERRERRPGAPPLGTNRVFVTTYSNSAVLGATLDGEPIALGVQDELGTRAHIAQVSIPRGTSVTLVYDVEGTFSDGEYRLRLSHQPLSRPDDVSLTISSTSGSVSPLPSDATDVSVRQRDLAVTVG